MSTNSKKITRIFVSQGSIEKRETGLNFFGFLQFSQGGPLSKVAGCTDKKVSKVTFI